MTVDRDTAFTLVVAATAAAHVIDRATAPAAHAARKVRPVWRAATFPLCVLGVRRNPHHPRPASRARLH